MADVLYTAIFNGFEVFPVVSSSCYSMFVKLFAYSTRSKSFRFCFLVLICEVSLLTTSSEDIEKCSLTIAFCWMRFASSSPAFLDAYSDGGGRLRVCGLAPPAQKAFVRECRSAALRPRPSGRGRAARTILSSPCPSPCFNCALRPGRALHPPPASFSHFASHLPTEDELRRTSWHLVTSLLNRGRSLF